MLIQAGFTNMNVIYKHSLSNVEKYNQLLMSTEFWMNFTSEYILLTQIDVMVFSKVTDEFFGYDYIGAPWDHDPPRFNKKSRARIGNGGYSLRNVAAMKKSIKRGGTVHNMNEDIYFANHVEKQPTIKLATTFSVEVLYCHNCIPTGLHQLHAPREMGSYFRAFVKITQPINSNGTGEIVASPI